MLKKLKSAEVCTPTSLVLDWELRQTAIIYQGVWPISGGSILVKLITF